MKAGGENQATLWQGKGGARQAVKQSAKPKPRPKRPAGALSEAQKLDRNTVLRGACCLAYLQAWDMGAAEQGGELALACFPIYDYLAKLDACAPGRLRGDLARELLLEMGFMPTAHGKLAPSDHLAAIVNHYKPRLIARHGGDALSEFYDVIESLLISDVNAAIRRFGFAITPDTGREEAEIPRVWRACLAKRTGGAKAL